MMKCWINDGGKTVSASDWHTRAAPLRRQWGVERLAGWETPQREGGRELRSCAVVTKSAGKRILSPAAIGFKSESNSWPLPLLILKITNFLICALLSAQWRQEPLMRWRTSVSRCDWRVLNSELSAPSRSAPSSSSPRHGNGSVKRWLRAYVCGVHVCLCAQSKADA